MANCDRRQKLARKQAGWPAGARITDYISLGVIARTFPLAAVRAGLAQARARRGSEPGKQLPDQVVRPSTVSDAGRTTSGARGYHGVKPLGCRGAAEPGGRFGGLTLAADGTRVHRMGRPVLKRRAAARPPGERERGMLLAEPANHRYDWHWRLGPIPIRVHPGFWLVAGLLWLMNGPQMHAGLFNLVSLGIWLAAVFSAILIHELGHALASRWLAGARPRITLHAWGGLTVGATGQTRRQEVGIVAAGPVFSLATGLPFLALWLFWRLGWWVPPGEAARLAVGDLMWVNVGWGLLNALPIRPLDGGMILTSLLTARRPAAGWRLAQQVSLVAAVVAGVTLVAAGQGLAALLFLYLAFVNYQELRADRDAWG